MKSDFSITRRTFLKNTGCLAAGTVGCFSQLSRSAANITAAQHHRPNVIAIMVDDME